MSLFNSALVTAADTANMQVEGKSFLDSAGDAISYGGGAAVLSGLHSIYNTGAAGINFLGGSVEEIDTAKKLQDIDENWATYYQENKSAIDTVGFIGTSFIPGGLAIKGLNLMRAGSGGGALGRSLGFARTKQAQALDAALVELAAEGGTVFTRINKNKAAAMAWGFADQTLTAAAFETGVALTMKQSPLLADDSWWDIGKNALVGAAFGGIIGGGIDSLILNKSFKSAVSAIDSKQRNYDIRADSGNFNLAAGDKAYAVTDALTRLPTAVLPEDKLVDLSFHLAGGTTKRQVNMEKFFGNVIQDTERKALTDLELSLQALSTDPTVRQSLAELALNRLTSMRTAGADPANIRERMGDLLHEMKGLKAATDLPTVASQDLWYFNKTVSPDQLAKMSTLEDWQAAIRSNTPFADNAYKKPYIFMGSNEQLMGMQKNAAFIGREGDNGFPNLAAAWKAGKDVAFLQDGAIRVNDASSLWKRADDPIYSSSRYINTRTGAMTEDTVLTAADRLVAGKSLDEASIKLDRVYLAKKDGTTVIEMGTFKATGDAEYFTARHAWASKLKDSDIPSSVDVTDFSLMDRLRSYVASDVEDAILPEIYRGKELVGTVNEVSLSDLIRSTKISEAQRLFTQAAETGTVLDVRAVAYQLNVDAQWLETVVATRFKDSIGGIIKIDGKAIDSTQGLSLPLASYTRRENLLAEYERPAQFTDLALITPGMSFREKVLLIQEAVAANGGQFLTGELAWAERVRMAIQVGKNAAASVQGADRIALLPDLAQTAAKLADSTGSGASLLGSSNANYGDTLKLAMQDTGKHVHKWIQEDVADVVTAMGSLGIKLKNDPAAAAELGIITNLLRSTDEKYAWSALTPNQLILRELKLVETDPVKYAVALRGVQDAGKRATIEIESEVASSFLKVHSDLNGTRVSKRQVLNNAKGFTSNMDPDTVYIPPIDTTYFKHFVFVQPIQGKAFGTSEVSMIFGRDSAELSKRIASVDKELFEVVTKQDTERYFKAKELYDFNLTINEPRINSELKRTGALNNFQPEVRAENLVEDYMRWHQNQSGRLVRDSVETYYGQQFAEIRKLGESYTDLATSKFSGTLSKSKTEIINPFDDYIKTALDVSKRSEYTFLHQANEFVDALGTRAYQGVEKIFGNADKGIVTWHQANTQMEKLGIKGVYSSAEDFFAANVPRDRNIVREYVSKANAFLANSVLRLDFFNSIVNVVSTPMMLGTELASIRNLIKKDPILVGKLAELTSVLSPTGQSVPSTTKLIAGAVKNFFGAEKETLLARYMANGDVKDTLSQFHSTMDNLSMRADFKVFSDGVNKAFEFGAKLTMNEQAEQMTRFISADVMRQLTEPLIEAGKLSLKEQNAFISVFTNRVQGNYISSQRPIVFQGVLGSAVSLFQTYSFNLMQQLLRHVENKDTRAVATLFGMQAGTFGLSGTPFFEAVNTHLIGNSSLNQGHFDAYSLAPKILGKEVGDWLMYGTASAFPAFGDNWPALYTRGDINPRHMTILPIKPQDIPAIDAASRIVTNIVDVGKKLIGGADVSETLLQGLEHNGINRPLAGFAQVLSGKTTTSKGSLISASSDFDMVTSAARVMGAKPMADAVALNNQYRIKAYQAADTERREHLGEQVKSYLYRNEFPPDEVMETFMNRYARAGGRVEGFNAAMQRWSKDANVSVVEKMRAKMNSSYGQRLNEIMGGVPLEDFRNTPPDVEPVIPADQ